MFFPRLVQCCCFTHKFNHFFSKCILRWRISLHLKSVPATFLFILWSGRCTFYWIILYYLLLAAPFFKGKAKSTLRFSFYCCLYVDLSRNWLCAPGFALYSLTPTSGCYCNTGRKIKRVLTTWDGSGSLSHLHECCPTCFSGKNGIHQVLCSSKSVSRETLTSRNQISSRTMTT